MQPLGEPVKQYGLRHQQFDDDTQLYQAFTMHNHSTITKRAQWWDEVSSWMKNAWIKLNLGKTKVMLVAEESILRRLQPWSSVCTLFHLSFL